MLQSVPCALCHPPTLASHLGKLLPMRILPRGYSFPLNLTGGDTIRFPMESTLATLWSLVYRIT